IAAIVAAGGQAGIAREYLLGYAQDAAKMGVAFDMAAGDAGTAMATMANVLGKPIKEMARFGDVINHLSDNANAKAADIVNVIARAGSDTRMLGLTENQAAALGSTFLSMGKAPELAAQAIKGMSASFADLKAGKHAKELAMLGLTPKSFAKAMNKDAQGAISDFIERVKKLPKDKQYPILAKMFGRQYADDMMLLAQNTAEYNRQLGLLEERDENGNLKYIGSMEREFQNRSATTENNLQLLKNSFTEIGNTIGEKLLPVINTFVNWLKPIIYNIVEWIDANSELVTMALQVGGAVIGAAGGFLAMKSALSLGLAILLSFKWGVVKLFSGVVRLAVGLGRTIVYIAKASMFAFNLGKILAGLLFKGIVFVSKAAWGLAKVLGGALVKGITLAGKAMLFLGRALMANPILIVIGIIAAAAYYVWSNWATLQPKFQALWQTITGYFEGAWQWIKGAWSGVGEWVSSVWDSVTIYFSNLWGSVTSLFSGNFNQLGNLILAFNPLALFQQAFSAVLSWFGVDMPAMFTNFGKNIIDGLVNGIKNTWESVKQSVLDLGGNITSWFKEKLGIHSPSRVFMGFGVNTVEGLAIGLDKSAPIATQSIAKISEQMQQGMSAETALKMTALSSQAETQPYQSLQQTYQQHQIERDTQGREAININFNPTIQVNGSQEKSGLLNDIQQGLNMSLIEFEQLLNRVLDQRQRRAY
ncbi:phage tail tape measure protein, partial [Pasteurellaceae bacterium 22721_9_1]